MPSSQLNISAGVLTVSDSSWRGDREDLSGPLLQRLLSECGINSTRYEIVPDEKEQITQTLTRWSDLLGLDLILTTGGTGVSPRDVTPEATLPVLDRQVPGIAEALRFTGLEKTPMAMISRGLSGLRGKCLIINLPGSPKACAQAMELLSPVLPHVLAKALGDQTPCDELLNRK